MSLTIDQNNLKRVSEGNKWRILGEFALDNSYPAGGYPIIPAQVGLDQLQSFIVNDNTLGYLFDYDSGFLHVYQGSGGGGIFTGLPLPPHSHPMQNVSESLQASPDTFVLTTGATGFFVVGEVITGGTSGATATVTVGNNNPTSDIGFTPIAGHFTIGETITGGISGSTAFVGSDWFSLYVPTFPPLLLEGCRGSGIAFGRPAIIASNIINPMLSVEINTIVGNFADFEIITGGTSGSTMEITAREPGVLHGGQINWAVVGFTVGETVTGGTSGATAVVTNATFLPNVVHRTTSSQNPTGDFIIFYPTSVNMSPATFTYLSSNAIGAISAGTPTGTVAGSGSPNVEVAPGTNLSAIKNAEFEATGL